LKEKPYRDALRMEIAAAEDFKDLRSLIWRRPDPATWLPSRSWPTGSMATPVMGHQTFSSWALLGQVVAFLVCFRSSDGDEQAVLALGDVRHVERDQLRSAESARRPICASIICIWPGRG